MNFNQLQLKPFIHKALEQLHFTEMTPVQAAVIPQAMQGKNLIVQSQTGSGKTHSFLIPILEQIDPHQATVQAVITAPSRELATQLYQVALELSQFSEHAIQIVNYVGGTDKLRQMDALSPTNQPHIVIGTPGRILDLMREHALHIQTAQVLVVDEADMTMDLGFLDTLDDIASRMPAQMQMMIFSATIPQSLTVFMNKYVTAPEMIVIEAKNIIADTITNYLINTKGQSRKELAYHLLTMGHPFLAMVFTNTKKYADEVSTYLKEKGLKVATIHGNIESRERKRLMKQIRDLEFQYVVATDLAARGIDIPGVSLVINMELPQDNEFFVHRVGRTGRNGIEGTAITMITPDKGQQIQELEEKGIVFQDVILKDNELIPTNARYRRSDRFDSSADQQDHAVRGMIIRNQKRRVKPGYKQKLNEQIKAHQRQQAHKKRRARRKGSR